MLCTCHPADPAILSCCPLLEEASACRQQQAEVCLQLRIVLGLAVFFPRLPRPGGGCWHSGFDALWVQRARSSALPSHGLAWGSEIRVQVSEFRRPEQRQQMNGFLSGEESATGIFQTLRGSLGLRAGPVCGALLVTPGLLLLQAKRRDSPTAGGQKASEQDSKQVPPAHGPGAGTHTPATLKAGGTRRDMTRLCFCLGSS